MSKYLLRRDKIRKIVSKQKLDALLITNPINLRYLTNFTGGSGCLLIQPSGDTILSDPRFTIQIEEECPGLETVIKPRSESTSKTLSKLFRKTDGNKIGFEADTITVSQKDQLFNDLTHWQPIPTKHIVEDLRQIKDKEEIAIIRQAIDIAHLAFRTVRECLEPSMDEIEIGQDLEFLMRRLGAEEKSFPSIIGAGARAALPHGTPSEQKVEDQSHLLFDWGCVYQGYMSDLTRVLIFNPNDKKLRKVYETVLKANEAAIAAIKPGKMCEEIDAVARNIIKDAGYGKYFGHGLGHSVGLQIHEDPRFSPGDLTLLKPGMVITVEPGIYIKGWGGVRIEDDILVTRTGCEVLSKDVPKSFDEMITELDG